MNQAEAKIEEVKRDLADLRANIERLTRTPRVLIVDDVALDSQVLREAITTTYRVEVQETTSCESALQICETVSFDAVFLNVVIPGMGCLEFMRRIKCPNSVIMVTRHDAAAPDILEAVKLGAVMVIKKPASLEDLRKIFGGLHG